MLIYMVLCAYAYVCVCECIYRKENIKGAKLQESNSVLKVKVHY